MATTIRVKIWAALLILILLVSTLAVAGLYTVRLYQQQVRDVTWRVNVLPVAGKLSRHVADMQNSHSELSGLQTTQWRGIQTNEQSILADAYRSLHETQMSQTLSELRRSYEEYRQLLEDRVQQVGIKESFGQEFTTVEYIRSVILDLDGAVQETDWSSRNIDREKVENLLKTLQNHTDRLPEYIAKDLSGYSQTMRRQSDLLRMIVIICVSVSVILMLLLIGFSYFWIFKPLRILIDGSRQVASGKYGYRIALSAKDEMGELAAAMNFTTERFEENVRQLEESRRDLDEKVQQKSRELIQSERLASVGFLAAGVAHEINNPMMTISACAESLQRRIETIFNTEAEDRNYVKRYLTMIQEEAFRCKGITERLLGLARNETKERSRTDFVPIIKDMLEMLQQQDAFKQKNVQLYLPHSFEITVNAQEMKQVVLNLLTNAFQNTEPAGHVAIKLYTQGGAAIFSVRDDGTGMDAEVCRNIFEPFFTRRAGGSGLGLSVTHRIIDEHQGHLSVFSEGIGKGSTFIVELPFS